MGAAVNPEYRKAVFDAYAQVSGEMVDDTSELEVTGYVVQVIAARARYALGITARSLRSETVRLWLTRPDEFSPYVDDVLVERALQFEPTIQASLSSADYEAFLHRLAELADPWALDGDNIRVPSEGNHGDTSTGDWGGGLNDPRWVAPERILRARRVNWLALPEWRRNKITERVRVIRAGRAA